jgi:2,3-bisphosphoglycerate-dependent phosphoglycerate mutase
MAKLALVRHGQSQWNLENRFTGWVDVPLTDLGREEARRAGERLRGIGFDEVYTSVLARAQETLDIILEVVGQKDIPVVREKALNERHYGALQGLNKKETADKYGEEQVHIWRLSYDVPPPKDRTELNPEGISESLKDTAARTLPYFRGQILPELQAGKNVLVVAHGNSLRSIVMDLDKLTKEQVLELNIATGVPILYEIDATGAVKGKQILTLS